MYHTTNNWRPLLCEEFQSLMSNRVLGMSKIKQTWERENLRDMEEVRNEQRISVSGSYLVPQAWPCTCHPQWSRGGSCPQPCCHRGCPLSPDTYRGLGCLNFTWFQSSGTQAEGSWQPCSRASWQNPCDLKPFRSRWTLSRSPPHAYANQHCPWLSPWFIWSSPRLGCWCRGTAWRTKQTFSRALYGQCCIGWLSRTLYG